MQARGERDSRSSASLLAAVAGDLGDEDPYIGQAFGRFVVRERKPDGIGTRVYGARHQRTNREVLIRVLAPVLANDRTVVDQFFEDARAVSDHENILELIEVGFTPDGLPYFVSESVKGGTLADLIESGPLSVKRALGIVDQITAALRAAHERGLWHGALSPFNVHFVDADPQSDRIKISEFGFSRFDLVKNVLAEGPFVRATEYLAPEQIDDPSKLDTRVDIYALGATLYAMLLGTSPFAGVDESELLPAVVEVEPRKVREVRPELRVSLAKLVHRSMKKAREQRYENLAEFETSLAALEREPQGEDLLAREGAALSDPPPARPQTGPSAPSADDEPPARVGDAAPSATSAANAPSDAVIPLVTPIGSRSKNVGASNPAAVAEARTALASQTANAGASRQVPPKANAGDAVDRAEVAGEADSHDRPKRRAVVWVVVALAIIAVAAAAFGVLRQGSNAAAPTLAPTAPATATAIATPSTADRSPLTSAPAASVDPTDKAESSPKSKGDASEHSAGAKDRPLKAATPRAPSEKPASVRTPAAAAPLAAAASGSPSASAPPSSSATTVPKKRTSADLEPY